MKRKISTHRLDAKLDSALQHLSEITRRPKNSLINEAVANFVRQRGSELEIELEETLEKLRSYRQADPDFEQAIADFAQAETAGAGRDPFEGASNGLIF